jgi:hypothetical protein
MDNGGRRWAPKNDLADEKTFVGKDASMGMDNGYGECGPEKMMRLRRRWAGEKMCPHRESRARERMWLGGKDGP